MALNEELLNDQDEEEYCPHCWARDVARQVLEAAAWNGLAAGLDPEEIEVVVHAVLSARVEPEAPDIGETVGSA